MAGKPHCSMVRVDGTIAFNVSASYWLGPARIFANRKKENSMPENEPLEVIKAPVAEDNLPEAKARFAKALEEAKGGASALGQEAQDRAGVYADKLSAKGSDLVDSAKERATALAEDGKARASGALSELGKVVSDKAPIIDEKLGPQYGDYARTAARSIQDVAARIDAKDLNDLSEDVSTFVRKSPGLAVGLAVVAGFMLSRLFRGSDD